MTTANAVIVLRDSGGTISSCVTDKQLCNGPTLLLILFECPKVALAGDFREQRKARFTHRQW